MGAVLAVIGDGPPVQGAGAVRTVGQRVAIGVVSDGRTADCGRRMRAPAGAIGEGRATAECGVGDEIIGVIIGVGPVFLRAAEMLTLQVGSIRFDHLRSGNPSRDLATRITQ